MALGDPTWGQWVAQVYRRVPLVMPEEVVARLGELVAQLPDGHGRAGRTARGVFADAPRGPRRGSGSGSAGARPIVRSPARARRQAGPELRLPILREPIARSGWGFVRSGRATWYSPPGLNAPTQAEAPWRGDSLRRPGRLPSSVGGLLPDEGSRRVAWLSCFLARLPLYPVFQVENRVDRWFFGGAGVFPLSDKARKCSAPVNDALPAPLPTA